jgi:E2/UBC family protein E
VLHTVPNKQSLVGVRIRRQAKHCSSRIWTRSRLATQPLSERGSREIARLSVAAAALRIKPSYPDDDIDMVYFHPALALTSGKSIGQLSLLALDGKQYQQWSRHRTPANPWRPGLDNVCTHLLQVNNWLERELKK